MTNFSDWDLKCDKNPLPKGFLQLHSVANIENTTDALSVFLHTCMLDEGFIAKNLDENEVYRCMPEKWKVAGASKFQYSHLSCPKVFCWMTCVPFYKYIAIHGALEDGGTQNSVYIKIKTTKYLRENFDLTDAKNIFVNSQKLVRTFKDSFCFALLALLQEKAGCAPTFGIAKTVDEIKLCILQLLPVQSVCALSCVNKDFDRVSKSSHLWRYLLQRDFGLIDSQSSSEDDFKDQYKKEYLKRKRVRRSQSVFDPYYFPSVYPLSPPRYIDLRRDLDPALQLAFPHLRDRFRPNSLFPPYDFPGWYMQ